MGMPGHIKVEIKTDFITNTSVSRTIRFIDGVGLDSIAAEKMGDPDFWHINSDIMRDTMDLDEGVYELKSARVTDGCGNEYYRWEVVYDG